MNTARLTDDDKKAYADSLTRMLHDYTDVSFNNYCNTYATLCVTRSVNYFVPSRTTMKLTKIPMA